MEKYVKTHYSRRRAKRRAKLCGIHCLLPPSGGQIWNTLNHILIQTHHYAHKPWLGNHSVVSISDLTGSEVHLSWGWKIRVFLNCRAYECIYTDFLNIMFNPIFKQNTLKSEITHYAVHLIYKLTCLIKIYPLIGTSLISMFLYISHINHAALSSCTHL